MTIDVLSDVLRAVRLTGALYFDFELSSPWVAEAPPSREIASIVMPGAQRVIEYHLIARGSGWANAVGEAPRRVSEGDLIAFPQGDAHVLSSEPGLRAEKVRFTYKRQPTPLPMVSGRSLPPTPDRSPVEPSVSSRPRTIFATSASEAARLEPALRSRKNIRP